MTIISTHTHTHTQSLSLFWLPNYAAINWKIRNCLPWETTLNFHYWDVSTCKPSPEAWTTICSPRGLGPDLQKANLKWRSPEHLSPATAGLSVPCVLGLSPAGSSSSVHGRVCCKKRHPNIGNLKLIVPSANSVSPLKIAVSRSANTRHWQKLHSVLFL